jgi:diacylglycerol O-acyltransferase
VPLFVLGKRMVSATAYVPIAGGTRCSIGIFSYLNTMTFGINADFDGYPDVDVLATGIRRSIDQLLKIAGASVPPAEKPAEPAGAAPKKAAPARKSAAKKTAAKRVPAKKTAAAGR